MPVNYTYECDHCHDKSEVANEQPIGWIDFTANRNEKGETFTHYRWKNYTSCPKLACREALAMRIVEALGQDSWVDDA